jgi:hypothetical protein
LKILTYEEKGKRHNRLVRDTDTDPFVGMPQDPPDIDLLDWEQIKIDLHNLLLDMKLLTVKDLENDHANLLTSAILSVMKTRLIRLYREHN